MGKETYVNRYWPSLQTAVHADFDGFWMVNYE